MLAQALARGWTCCDNAVMSMQREDLVGSWRLVRWTIEYPDGRPAVAPFGATPVGLLVYGADGWMTATMSHATRSALSHVSAPLATPESRARAFAEYLSYAGRWELRGDQVVHQVELSLNPALIGTVQWRTASLDGARLELTAEEADAASGRRRLHRIGWQRAAAVAAALSDIAQ
jgi:hypothetical protein